MWVKLNITHFNVRKLEFILVQTLTARKGFKIGNSINNLLMAFKSTMELTTSRSLYYVYCSCPRNKLVCIKLIRLCTYDLESLNIVAEIRQQNLYNCLRLKC